MDIDQIMTEERFFAIWRFNFEGQLRNIYHNSKVEDEGQVHHFMDLPFIDFALLVYTENPSLIDYQQN